MNGNWFFQGNAPNFLALGSDHNRLSLVRKNREIQAAMTTGIAIC